MKTTDKMKKETFNPQQHYDNTKGSLYKLAEDLKLNHWEFDILKRLVRCRKKGQFNEDLKKIKDTIDIYLMEYGKDNVTESTNNVALMPEEECKATLNTLEEPYRTQALENFDSEWFRKYMYLSFNRRWVVIGLAFDWSRTPQGYEYWNRYCDKLLSQGE